MKKIFALLYLLTVITYSPNLSCMNYHRKKRTEIRIRPRQQNLTIDQILEIVKNLLCINKEIKIEEDVSRIAPKRPDLAEIAHSVAEYALEGSFKKNYIDIITEHIVNQFLERNFTAKHEFGNFNYNLNALRLRSQDKPIQIRFLSKQNDL